MKNRKLPIPERLMLAIGLLMATIPQLLKTYIHIPDFLLGALVGGGLGLEIMAFVKLRKDKNRDVVY